MTAPAHPLPIPAPGLRVVGGYRTRRAPRAGVWLGLTVVVLAAFFLLIFSRVALDRSAFVGEEIGRQMAVEEARYWQLRLEAAELQAPERIVDRALELGMVYPAAAHTLEVARMGSPGDETEDRWADLKALLGAQP